MKLDNIATSKLSAKLKLNKVRHSSYFHTAALYALKQLYDENNLTFPADVLLEIAASLRVRYKPMLEFSHCGFHTAIVIFPVDKQRFGKFVDFWRDVKYVHELIVENTSVETGSLFSTTHSSQLENTNKIYSQTDSLDEMYRRLNQEIQCDLVVSNLSRFVNDHVKVFSESPLNIKEMYCTDPLNSNPSISPGVILHIVYWRGEIFIQIGANKSVIGSAHVNRFKDLYIDFISSTLD